MLLVSQETYIPLAHSSVTHQFFKATCTLRTAQARLSASSDIDKGRSFDNDIEESNWPANKWTITKEGKFRWSGSFEKQEATMNALLGKKVKWTSPGGYSQTLETDGLELRSYPNNYSLTVKGNGYEEIKTQLQIMAKLFDKKTRKTSRIVWIKRQRAEQLKTIVSKKPYMKHRNSIYSVILDSIRDLEQRFLNKFD